MTHPVSQFAATPAHDGRAFAGWKGGYHASNERSFYVTGLSDIIDTAVGGRFYIHPDSIACPECDQVIAWIDTAIDDRNMPAIHPFVSRAKRRQPKPR